MKTTSLALLALWILAVTGSSVSFAEAVIKKEVQISPVDLTVVDPEFEPTSFQVSFQNMGEGGLYLGQIDPSTGGLANFDFQYIDTPAPIYRTFNGPEWGYSAQGVGIYFTKADANGYYHGFRYRDGKVTQLDRGNFHLVANYCSKSTKDQATLVMGANFPPSSLAVKPLVINWGVLSEDNPSDIRYYPMTSIGKGPRFVPGARKVTTNLLDPKGVLQVALFDFDTKTTKQVTFDGDRKNSAVVFEAPELNNEAVLSASVLTELGDGSTRRALDTLLPNAMLTAYDKLSQTVGQVGRALRVYRKDAKGYQPYKEIVPKTGPLLMNPQVFTYKGKTYYSMEQFTLSSILTNHQIVIQDLEGKVHLAVGGDTKMVRFDPEVVISGDRIFVYYYKLPGFQLYMSEIKLP